MRARSDEARGRGRTARVLAVLLGLLAQAPGAAVADLQRPTPHELGAIAASGGERLWYHEAEFGQHPGLSAGPHQVVILDLEPAGRGRKLVRNTIPYRFSETATHSFCVPRADAHIRGLKLQREGSPAALVSVPRGAPCKTATIAPGPYRLVVEHDAAGIGPEGRKAFVHVPRLRQPRGVGGTPASFSCDALSAIRAPNGNFVVQGSTSAGLVAPSTGVDLLTGGWQLCIDANGDYTVQLPRPSGPLKLYSESTVFPAPGNLVTYPDLSHHYTLTDLGNFELTMKWAYNSATYYPITLGSDGTLHWVTSGAPSIFDIPVKYYLPGAAIPPLQAGEVALFHGGIGDTTHGTWVVRGNVPNAAGISYSNPFLGTLELLGQSGGTPISVRTGPDTVASFYASTDYRILKANVGEDTANPNNNPFGSIKVTTARDFIIATDQCRNCNLSGVDLSGLDLSSGWFSGSTFAGANLTDTDLTEAIVDETNFSADGTLLAGARFVDSFLDSANFRGVDLSQTDFRSTSGLLVSDLSVRPDLTGATLDVDTFLPSDWRWLNLTNAAISGVNGTVLSTLAQPLDLSDALLGGVDLSGAVLDGANLGGARLNGASLASASLKRTGLQNALLQGADLNAANLDGADLCAAELNETEDTKISAILSGAFLRNVNLYQADLTGADLVNANLFSTGSSGTCSAACGFNTSCASLVGARLKNADFSGAYLAGVDFSDSSPQSAKFTGANLAGSNFDGANLTQDTATGTRTDFTGAWLEGTNFQNAPVTGAIFGGALVDGTQRSDSHGKTLVVQLDPAKHVAFPGYAPATGSTPGCVMFTTSQGTTVPGTDGTNICPDGHGGPCSAAQWQAIAPPSPPACALDFNWIFVTYPAGPG